ncbi:MAG: M48 family metalloprotease [Actinobacteria bacterium]|nr:M48 family metalloprotease [Actinomycetota bacterium]
MYEEIDRNRRVTWILIIGFIAFVAFLGYIFGELTEFGYFGLVIALVIAFSTSFTSYYYSDRIVLSISRARPVEKTEFPYLYNTVEGLSIAAGLPMPKLYVIDDPAPNAFATGRDPEHSAIAVTTGLLEKMNRLELEGVIGHEMSHIAGYDIRLSTLAVVLVGSIFFLSGWLRRSYFWGGLRRTRGRGRLGPIILIIGIIIAVLAPVAAQLLRLALSRNREYLADVQGAMLTRYPPGLADALRKLAADLHTLRTANEATAHLFIVNPLKAEGGVAQRFSELFSTHPPIEDRIRRLDEMSLGEAPGGMV